MLVAMWARCNRPSTAVLPLLVNAGRQSCPAEYSSQSPFCNQGLNHVEQHRAVGVVETWSVAPALTLPIVLSKLRMSFSFASYGFWHWRKMLHGGCWRYFRVNNAVSVASERAGEKGLLVYGQ